MSRLNKLFHGEASEAAAILSGDTPHHLTNTELRAALTNALNRIDRIEQHSAYLAAAIIELREKGK